MSETSEEMMVDMSDQSASPPLGLEEHSLDDSLIHGSALSKAAAPHSAPKKNSLCYDIFMPILVVALFAGGLVTILVANNWRANDPTEIAKIYHEKHPFIDGKNQLPYAIKAIYKGDLKSVNLNEEHTAIATDIPGVRKGKLGGVVWSSYMPCGIIYGNEGPAAVERTLYQMDIIYDIIRKYYTTFKIASDPAEVPEIFSNDKLVSSVISIEGGHQIHDDLSVLRMFRKLGAISMSLTHECSTAWAETENPYNTQYTTVKGITDFGVSVIAEMNRIGMMVDLSHTSVAAMTLGLQVSQAPVLFSLSGAKALCDSPLNVPDSLFDPIAKKGGVVMVPLFPPAICGWAATLFDQYRAGLITQTNLVQQYDESTQSCGIEEVFQHIDYLKTKLGVSRIGISSNFDANLGLAIKDLENTSKLINLTARLVKAGYSENDITGIIGGNFLKAWAVAEQVSEEILLEELGGQRPTGIFTL